ncbi:leukocyte receptor cluster member 1 homolog [Aricia agestis]|uniref:leukocyte receptor cluster member 1 homolog n=1 Tax=Aricia agestis TaxID=91739 RepID=UPI001C20AD45|nr:leukocyte receptor cluster member 1 homolog [Aricia agestis]XP_041987491.1 leukocyte receptor cluster member 1 homolog [Aricia agestis]
MNILPKKRWHVRTKENIARVRRDEAEAAEKERQELLRIEAANREARLNVLKQKRKKELAEKDVHVPDKNDTPIEHINLFSDLEHAVKTTNKDHDSEIKEKKEDYEKKIGYLTYLGQDTNEALGKKNWYELPPETSRFCRPDTVKDTYDKLVLKDEEGKPKKVKLDEKDGEIGWRSKQRLDPIHMFKKKDGCSSKSLKDKSKHHITKEKLLEKGNFKSHKHTNNNAISKLEKLREARLKREMEEKYRTEMFLKNLGGGDANKEKEKPKQLVPKYNSQFNPEFARQNFR